MHRYLLASVAAFACGIGAASAADKAPPVVEANFGWVDNNTPTGGIPGTRSGFLGNPSAETAFVNESRDGSVRGRLGYPITASTLLFGTGGPPISDHTFFGTSPGNDDRITAEVAAAPGPEITAGVLGMTFAAGVLYLIRRRNRRPAVEAIVVPIKREIFGSD
jgi:hypothetical protein